MGLQIDWENELIKVTSPTTNVDAQVLHDFIEDEMASPVGMTHNDIQNPEGKIEDPNNPGVYSQIIIQLNSPWQIQFWGGSGYTRIYGGKIVGGLGGEPMKATGTAGDITVLESPVDGLTVVTAGGGTSFTEAEKAQMRDALGMDGDKTTAVGGQLQNIPAQAFHISIVEDVVLNTYSVGAWMDEAGQPALDLDGMTARVLNLDGTEAEDLEDGAGGGAVEAGVFRWEGDGTKLTPRRAYVLRVTATRGSDTWYGNRGFSKAG